MQSLILRKSAVRVKFLLREQMFQGSIALTLHQFIMTDGQTVTKLSTI